MGRIRVERIRVERKFLPSSAFGERCRESRRIRLCRARHGSRIISTWRLGTTRRWIIRLFFVFVVRDRLPSATSRSWHPTKRGSCAVVREIQRFRLCKLPGFTL